MFRLFYTPDWFNGLDLVFDTVSLFIALLIAAYSWRLYRIHQENKYGYFSFAFILIGLAFAAKMVMAGLLYYAPLRNAATAVLIPVVGKAATGINYSQLFFRTGFFVSMVTMLGAWLLLFFVSQKKEGRLKRYYEVSQIALFVYLLLLISIVSNFKYQVFYLTSSVILGMTVLNYYKNFLNTDRNRNAWRVMLAFLLFLFANFAFIFVFIFPGLYVLGEIFMVAGFLVLLKTYAQIQQGKMKLFASQNPKKRDPVRDSVRDRVDSVNRKPVKHKVPFPKPRKMVAN
ncbi:hypothetical protein J4210_06370 [Candidatus Woesearchaeota archaeon]|nr:hypothetical protein [Candidatus Woesearchaeota archaeon]